jgi:peroxiredoxin
MQAAWRPLSVGEPAPWFVTPSLTNPAYHFHTVAGRHVVLFFAGSLAVPQSVDILRGLLAHRTLFDDDHCALFVVAADEADVTSGRLRDSLPGVRVLCDYDASVSRRFGIALPDPAHSRIAVRPSVVLLDATLRVVEWWFAGRPGAEIGAEVAALVGAVPEPPAGPAQVQAPVMVVPRVFEPEFCRELIAYYDRQGSVDSGFMMPGPDGIRGVIDYSVKRRRDSASRAASSPRSSASSASIRRASSGMWCLATTARPAATSTRTATTRATATASSR